MAIKFTQRQQYAWYLGAQVSTQRYLNAYSAAKIASNLTTIDENLLLALALTNGDYAYEGGWSSHCVALCRNDFLEKKWQI